MKKFLALILAAGLVFSLSTYASAVDFKAKGRWAFNFTYGENGNFTGGGDRTGYNSGEDRFEASQQVRLQLEAAVSEMLSGTVHFEMGGYNRGTAQFWGQAGSGGALGADSNWIKIKHAYLDWVVPETDLKIRMGIQPLALPDFLNNSQVLNDDAAAITASYKFNENFALTAFWARLYNDNTTSTGTGASNSSANYMDNIDAFALVGALTFDGVKVSPWALYAGIGPAANYNNLNNTQMYNYWGNPSSWMGMRSGMIPVFGGSKQAKLSEYGNAFWVGLPGQIDAFDPFTITWDFNYGSVQYDDSSLNRAGWLAGLMFEYKLDWGIPGLYGWYTSGDDSSLNNGSERMPFLHPNAPNGFSTYAFHGDLIMGRDGVVGKSMVGTWGIGARVKNVSFIDKLRHTFRINYMGGTNNPGILKSINRSYSNGKWLPGSRADIDPQGFWMAPNDGSGLGREGLYMTRNDSALEFGLNTVYSIYDNLSMYVDANYVALFLDKSDNVWGRSLMNGRSDDARDAWNVGVTFVYQF